MAMTAADQKTIEQEINRALRDLSRTNPFRLKAGLRILMTTDLATFEKVCSTTVQQDLADFKKLITHPQGFISLSTESQTDIEEALKFIKQYTLNHFHLLDNRTAILPNTHMVKQSIMEGERLKSVVHASALRNIVTNAHYVDSLEKKFKEEGVPLEEIEHRLNKIITAIQELHKAVLEGNISQILKSLAIQDVDINYPNEQGMTPLHLATREGLTETVKLLLTVPNIRVNLVSNNGWTPLHIAARMGHADIVDALLTLPTIDPNVVNSDGWSALHWAAWHGFTDTVTVLLTAHGIKVNIADKNETTPLHLAARNGHANVITILISAVNNEPNLIDDERRSPLHLATIYNHEEAVAALLLSPKIEVNLADVDGLTALHWAARNGHMGILNRLLAHRGVLTDVLDNNGVSPLEWAIRNHHTAVIDLLQPYYANKQRKVSLLMKIFNLFKNRARQQA